MDKRRAQDKPYYIYTAIVANKLLCIYHERIKEYLACCPKRKKPKTKSNAFIRPAFCGGLVFVLFNLYKIFKVIPFLLNFLADFFKC